MARMISKQKAAELLDCKVATVNNWLEGGLIQGHKVGRQFLIDRHTIEQYFDSLKDLAATEEQLAGMIKEQKAILKEATGKSINSEGIREAFIANQLTLVSLCKDYLDERSVRILTGILNGEDPEAIGDELGLTRIRIIQLAASAALKTSKITEIKQKLEEYEKLKEENKQLIEKNERLKNFSGKHESLLLQKPVSELEISVRTKNALATLNCKTLGDVVQHSMFDLLKARHIGKKSLVEIDELVNEYGLHWGMRLNG